MSDNIKFQNAFFDAMIDLRNEVDTALISFIHVIQSQSLSMDQKLLTQEKLIEIGDELGAFLSSIKFQSINQYNIREIEETVTKKFSSTKKNLTKFKDFIDSKLGVRIDPTRYFSIKEIIDLLAVSRIGGNMAISRDKLDNIVSIKTFILKVYEFQQPGITQKGGVSDFEKDFFAIKEKALIETLRNPGNSNPEYLFRSVEILKKRYGEKRHCRISRAEDEDFSQGEILFSTLGTMGFVVRYAESGLSILISVMKWSENNSTPIEASGYIEKGVSRIVFYLKEGVTPKQAGMIEHLSGIDFVYGLFEQVYRESQIKEDTQKKQDDQARGVVNKVIDDILFG